jgi:hypothetical protein
MFSILATVMVAGFGGIGGILIKMNGTLGEMRADLKNCLGVVNGQDDDLRKHDKRIKKLQKKVARLHRP